MNIPLYDIYFKTCPYISIFFIHAVFYQINYFFWLISPQLKKQHVMYKIMYNWVGMQ